MINFPDEIVLPKSAVRVGSSKTIMIHNEGKISAPFSITCGSRFSVYPAKAALHPSERMQLTVHFLSRQTGSFESCLTIYYETGEKLCVKLSATAENAHVDLEKSSIYFRDTYMGLTNQQTLEVFNRSQYIVKYKWKQYATHMDDVDRMAQLASIYKSVKEHESKRCTKLEWHGLIDYEGHSKVYQRIYENEVEELAYTEEFFYQSSTFKIIPMVR